MSQLNHRKCSERTSKQTLELCNEHSELTNEHSKRFFKSELKSRVKFFKKNNEIMNFFEIMKYFARATKQMRAVDGILKFQFPCPKAKLHI